MTPFQKAVTKLQKECGESKPNWNQSFEAGWDAALKFRDEQVDAHAATGAFAESFSDDNGKL